METASTSLQSFYPSAEPGLRPTELPDVKPLTTNTRVLAVSSGLRTVNEVLWGDASFDPFTAIRFQQLAEAGATPARGNSVPVREHGPAAD